MHFVLVTPARNEATFIEDTVKCVVRQTVKPLKWVIVSDGSTDGTDEIVQKYTTEFPWIELLRTAERKERNFAGKVGAFNAGYDQVKDLDYQIIGNLDADITFDDDYFAYLITKFAENPRLGVAGTPFTEDSTQYNYRFTSPEHVSGQCQLFRRTCFEDIGGYIPRKIGGIDLIAVITARMHGWQTMSFLEKIFVHHRKMNTANYSVRMVAFRGGRGDYVLGGHPAWELFRCIYQMKNPPVITGGVLRFAGFMWTKLTGVEIQVSPEVAKFRQAEQLRRLREFFVRIYGRLKKAFQNTFWIYVTAVFAVRSSNEIRFPASPKPYAFVPITIDNYYRVRDFRAEERILEYREKLKRGEVGYFAQLDERMVGSIWATVNHQAAPCVARTYMRLQPGEALIHDIVTGEPYRGMGVGPFMTANMCRTLLTGDLSTNVVIDVNVRNTPSLRMMNKVGLYAKRTVLSISTLGRLLAQKNIRHGAAAPGDPMGKEPV